jgi:hypothetical protein
MHIKQTQKGSNEKRERKKLKVTEVSAGNKRKIEVEISGKK